MKITYQYPTFYWLRYFVGMAFLLGITIFAGVIMQREPLRIEGIIFLCIFALIMVWITYLFIIAYKLPHKIALHENKVEAIYPRNKSVCIPYNEIMEIVVNNKKRPVQEIVIISKDNTTIKFLNELDGFNKIMDQLYSFSKIKNSNMT